MDAFSLTGVMALQSLLLAKCTYLIPVFEMLFSLKVDLCVISGAVITGFFGKKITSFDSVVRKRQLSLSAVSVVFVWSGGLTMALLLGIGGYI
ncbi:MAG: hypothetical protein ACTS73_09260 [Arsenophonus sp. NEOnobi-MAG3]